MSTRFQKTFFSVPSTPATTAQVPWRSGATKKATFWVGLTPTGVKIGEEGNVATLTHKEWNLLVDLIQSGELKTVPV